VGTRAHDQVQSLALLNYVATVCLLCAVVFVPVRDCVAGTGALAGFMPVYYALSLVGYSLHAVEIVKILGHVFKLGLTQNHVFVREHWLYFS